MKIQIALTLEIGDWCIDESKQEEVQWLLGLLRESSDLRLHSNEIGDQIGEVISVEKVNIITS